jgi:hypothetical protein
MTKNPPIIAVPPLVEELRSVFNQATREHSILPRRIGEILEKEMNITWPASSLNRFMTGQTRRVRFSLEEVVQMTALVKKEFKIQAAPVLEIPLSDTLRTMINNGLIDVDAVVQAAQNEIQRQLFEHARLKPGAVTIK